MQKAGHSRSTPYLCIKEHMLANWQAKLMLGGLKPKSEQASIWTKANLLSEREGYLLTRIECNQLLA